MSRPKVSGISSDKNREWMHQWLDRARWVFTDSQMLEYNGIVAAFIVWNRCAMVNATRLQEYVNFVGVRDTTSMTHKVMKAFQLIYHRLPGRNPAEGLKVAIQVVSTPRPAITQEQYTHFRDFLGDGYQGPAMRFLAVVLWHTGLAKKDACNLEWKDVDMSRLIVTGRRHKTGSEYTIPFELYSELHRALLTQQLDPMNDQWVSHYLHHQYSSASFEGRIQQACRHVGLPSGSGCHSFRRAFVTRLIKAGVRDLTITKMSGHSTTQMLSTYYKPDEKDLRRAISTIEDQPPNPQVLPDGRPDGQAAGDQ